MKNSIQVWAVFNGKGKFQGVFKSREVARKFAKTKGVPVTKAKLTK